MGTSDEKLIVEYLGKSLQAMQAFAGDEGLRGMLSTFVDVISETMASGGKLMLAGNGGSAADAQHIAGEFISRLFFDHEPLPAIALTTDTSVLTATGNDYGYEKIFVRQVQGLGRKSDVFLGISTSGTSKNILAALEAANDRGIVTLGFSGSNMGPMDSICAHVFHAPSSETAIIQQIHIVAAHIICGLVERRLCDDKAGA